MNWLWLQEDCPIAVRMYEMVSKTSAMIYIWRQISQCQMPKFGHFWPKIAQNQVKFSELLTNDVSIVFLVPKICYVPIFSLQWWFWLFDLYLGALLTPGAEGGWGGGGWAISQVPQGSKGKSFQNISRGPYRYEK